MHKQTMMPRMWGLIVKQSPFSVWQSLMGCLRTEYGNYHIANHTSVSKLRRIGHQIPEDFLWIWGYPAIHVSINHGREAYADPRDTCDSMQGIHGVLR